MLYRKLGGTDIDVSLICLGTTATGPVQALLFAAHAGSLKQYSGGIATVV